MDAFDQMWEASRHNSCSTAYPAIVGFGLLLLLGTCFIRQSTKRRLTKILLVFVLTAFATHAAGLQIVEKWRIRSEWSEAHWESLTESQQKAVVGDGANRVFGPIAAGLQAMVIFVGPLLAIRIVIDACRSGWRSAHVDSLTPPEVNFP